MKVVLIFSVSVDRITKHRFKDEVGKETRRVLRVLPACVVCKILQGYLAGTAV